MKSKPIYCPKCNAVVGKFPEVEFIRVELKCPECKVKLLVYGETKIILTCVELKTVEDLVKESNTINPI